MKKLMLIIGLFVLFFTVKVEAANYELMELIPKNIETTIVTDHFSYRHFYYNGDGYITFKSIKNISDEELPVTISIGLFDEDKKNIGVINYCSTKVENPLIEKLKSKEEQSFAIKITKDYIAVDKTIKDIKYIAVLHENINCNYKGARDFVGYTVEKIGVPKNSVIDDDTEFIIRIFEVIVCGLIIIFVYKFVFTNSYKNFDGEDIRQGYSYKNKELRKEREKEERKNKKASTTEVLDDEVIVKDNNKNESSENTDLHNFYK